MRLMLCLVLLLLPGLARADGEQAGDFDYYVLSLSWSPTWCAQEGDARNSPQCDAGRGFGWVLHGLWPQNERGWPSWCRTTERDPSRADTAAMEDIMGTSGLAWYQWQKHGRCSGLSARAYFETARAAYEAVVRPPVFRRLPRVMELPARVVEEAFLDANPGLRGDQITVTCRAGAIQEVRLCLTRDLTPRRCGDDVIRDCTLSDAEMAPIR